MALTTSDGTVIAVMNALHKLLLILLLATAGATTASAQNSIRAFACEGQLLNDLGTPVADGAYAVSFRLYGDEDGKQVVWTESQIVEVFDGTFNALLGLDAPIDATIGGNYWLGIALANEPEAESRMAVTLGADEIEVARTATGSVRPFGIVGTPGLIHGEAPNGGVAEWSSDIDLTRTHPEKSEKDVEFGTVKP